MTIAAVLSGDLAAFCHYGDNAALLAALPAESVDLIHTDPPYGTASESAAAIRGDQIVAFNHDWDKEFPTDWIAPAVRALKRGGSAFVWCDLTAVSDVRRALVAGGLLPRHVLIWDKPAAPNPRKNFMHSAEACVFAIKAGKRHRWNAGGATPSVIRCSPAAGDEKTAHPTQKPIEIVRKLIGFCSDPGDLILDPFAGSGSTAVAAVLDGRRCLTAELSEAFAEIAIGQIEDVIAGRIRVNGDRRIRRTPESQTLLIGG